MNITQEMNHIQRQNELVDKTKLLDRVLEAYAEYLRKGDSDILLSKLSVIVDDAENFGFTK
jgi:hypothetical protein